MRKTMKKVLSLALALLFMVSAVVIAPVDAKADEVTATFSLADADWSYQVWGDKEGATTAVTGAGTYKMSLLPYEATAEDGTVSTATPEGAAVFVIDIPFTKDVLAAQNYALSAVKLTVDGADFAIDTTKVVYGDLEEKGNLRIEFFNQWGPTAVSEKYDASVSPFDPSTLKATKSIEVEFTLVETDDPAYDADGKAIKYVGVNGEAMENTDGNDAPVADGTFDPAGKYNAYIGIQTPTYSYRNAWNEEQYGKHTEYFDQITKWIDNEATDWGGTFTDVEVAGNGTYTVGVTDLPSDFNSDFTTQDYFNLLFVSTDIPLSEELKITDVQLLIDGKKVHTYDEAYLNPDKVDYVEILVQNIWNDDVKEISYYPVPTKSVEIQFTIEGFSYDKAADDVADDTTPDTTTPDTQTGDNTDKGNEGGINPIVIVVVVVVIVAAVAIVLVMKKKK